MSGLLNEDALRDWLGYERRADVVRFLDDRRIDYWKTRGGRVVTTLRAIEAKLIEPEDEFVFEFE